MVATAAAEEQGVVDEIELREALLISPERREVEVTVLQGGLSRNAYFYSDRLLESAAPLLDGARAFADHPAPVDRAERSIRDIVGYYHSPRFEPASGQSPARIKATLRLVESAGWLWSMIEQAIDDKQPFIGLSVDFVGSVKPATRDGVAVKEIQAIRQLLSVDVVTRPSAGGRFERILNSEEIAMSPSETEQPETRNAELETVTEVQRLLDDARRERRVAETERALDGMLAASKLPQPFKDELRGRFAGSDTPAETIREAIDQQAAALAAAINDNLITGMGA